MTDEEMDDLYRRALATTARVVERPSGVEPFLPSDPVWCYADAFIDLVERVRTAERKGAEEMRKSAADWLRACSARATFTLHTPDGRPLNAEERRMHGEVETGLKSVLGTLADDIANRPLPGDAP